MQAFMNKVNKVKIQPELDNLRVAASFTDWSFKKVIKELEDSIEEDKPVKHKKIANRQE